MSEQSADLGMQRDPDNKNLATFKLAREEELRLLELQRSQIDNIRTRTSQYLAFVGSASAFLAGSGLRASDRDLWFVVSVAIAVTLSVAAVSLSYVLLSNLNLKRLFSDGRRLGWAWGSVSGHHALDYALSEVPTVSESDLARKLAERYQKARIQNGPALKALQNNYKYFLTVGSLQLLAWTIVVCTRGG